MLAPGTLRFPATWPDVDCVACALTPAGANGDAVRLPVAAAGLCVVPAPELAPATPVAVRATCDDELVVVLDDVLPRSVLSVWLMSISCSRLFTFTSWSMYSL